MPQAFLIDGYNLIHALGLVRKQLADKELETARRRLLEFLHVRLEPLAGAITVVFDAKRKPRHVPAEHHDGQILVRYAGRNQEADDVIEDLLAQHPAPRHLVVISEDRRLRQAAARRRAQSWSAQELLDHLEQPPATRHDRAPHPSERRPPSAKEVEDWLREFQGLELPNDFQDFLAPPQESD